MTISRPGARTAAHVRPAGTRRVSVVRAIRLDAGRDLIAGILSDYELLPLYEHKVDSVVVVRNGRGRATEVSLGGRFGLLPYRGSFLFTSRETGGFDSVLLESNAVVGFSGSFAVRRAVGGCIVTHVEQYEFRGGRLGQALGTLVRPYIGRSIDQELRRLKRLVEEPQLLATARRDPSMPIQPAAAPVWDPASRRSRMSMIRPL